MCNDGGMFVELKQVGPNEKVILGDVNLLDVAEERSCALKRVLVCYRARLVSRVAESNKTGTTLLPKCTNSRGIDVTVSLDLKHDKTWV